MVYQAFLTALGIWVGVMAPRGYFLAPWLPDSVNAAPAVQAGALSFRMSRARTLWKSAVPDSRGTSVPDPHPDHSAIRIPTEAGARR